MKILYTGPLRPGSLTESRRRALVSLGHQVVAVDQCAYTDVGPSWWRKAVVHLLIGPGIVRYNSDLVARAEALRPDLIYVDQAAYLTRRTVLALKSIGGKLVHYTSEWFGFRPYWYRRFLGTIDLYDVHVLTHPPSKAFLDARGAKRTIMTTFGYDPELHVPPELTDEDRRTYGSSAVFIGHWEPNTERHIVALRRSGVQVRVWGPGWSRARAMEDAADIRPVTGVDYVKALAAARIGLCILSHWNSNRYAASRTFEIPAVGTFLLAERTSLHQSFYKEGEEAEFFGDEAELLDKVRRYLELDDRRRAVAAAGHRRCVTSGYTHADRMREILAAVA